MYCTRRNSRFKYMLFSHFWHNILLLLFAAEFYFLFAIWVTIFIKESSFKIVFRVDIQKHVLHTYNVIVHSIHISIAAPLVRIRIYDIDTGFFSPKQWSHAAIIVFFPRTVRQQHGGVRVMCNSVRSDSKLTIDNICLGRHPDKSK